MRLLSLGLRIALGMLFIYGALAKLRQPYDFLATVYDYGIIGPPWGRYVAILVPHVEICVGILLLAGVSLLSAFLLATVLCMVFVMAQTWVLATGAAVKCGCFGNDDELISWSTWARATLCATAALTGLLLCIRRARPTLKSLELGFS